MKNTLRIRLSYILLVLLGFYADVFTACAQKITPMYDSLPVLPPDRSRLFYLQRTIDRNTLIYEANYNADGTINGKKPVKVYWIDFDNGGTTSPLTFIQNSFAYGVESKLIDKRKKIFLVNIEAYKKIDMYMEPDKNDQYKMYMMISGRKAALVKIVVYIAGGTYLKPLISSVEFTGDDLITGRQVTEKIYPQKQG